MKGDTPTMVGLASLSDKEDEQKLCTKITWEAVALGHLGGAILVPDINIH